MSALFDRFITLSIVSAWMYFVENAAQPEEFSSMFKTMRWGVATLTTVGHGDIHPITGLGRVLGGIIASGFLEYFENDED